MFEKFNLNLISHNWLLLKFFKTCFEQAIFIKLLQQKEQDVLQKKVVLSNQNNNNITPCKHMWVEVVPFDQTKVVNNMVYSVEQK